jgi:ribosomal protein S18 acetylase RimI-like enzyme
MRIREATPDDVAGIARVHVESWRTAYRGILPDSFLDGLTPESREERWRERLTNPVLQQFTLVVEDELGRLVGFAFGGPERDGTPGYDGEVYAIYLLAEWRRQGIGRQLLGLSARHLMEQGFRTAMLWAMEANRRARSFYEVLGGQLVGRKMMIIADTPQIEVAYGWPDLTMLVNAGSSVSTVYGFGADHDLNRSSHSASQRD